MECLSRVSKSPSSNPAEETKPTESSPSPAPWYNMVDRYKVQEERGVGLHTAALTVRWCVRMHVHGHKYGVGGGVTRRAHAKVSPENSHHATDLIWGKEGSEDLEKGWTGKSRKDRKRGHPGTHENREMG